LETPDKVCGAECLRSFLRLSLVSGEQRRHAPNEGASGVLRARSECCSTSMTPSRRACGMSALVGDAPRHSGRTTPTGISSIMSAPVAGSGRPRPASSAALAKRRPHGTSRRSPVGEQLGDVTDRHAPLARIHLPVLSDTEGLNSASIRDQQPSEPRPGDQGTASTHWFVNSTPDRARKVAACRSNVVFGRHQFGPISATCSRPLTRAQKTGIRELRASAIAHVSDLQGG